jgi:hypothetical protein
METDGSRLMLQREADMTHIDTSREAVANLMRSAREAGYMTVRGTLQEMSAALAALLDRAEKAEAELYAFKLAVAGGEDAPGAAASVTLKDVQRWMAEAARESYELDALKAEMDGLREALRFYAEKTNHTHRAAAELYPGGA